MERVEKLTAKGSASPIYVGVWGMGGVGKTLFLQIVYGMPRVQYHFQGVTFIWLTMGQSSNILSLYQTISKKVGSNLDLHNNQEDYKHHLYNKLKKTLVFLVLDDIWHDKMFYHLDLAKGDGSVMLLTTQDQYLYCEE